MLCDGSVSTEAKYIKKVCVCVCQRDKGSIWREEQALRALHVNKSEMLNLESKKENQDLMAGRIKLTNGPHRNCLTSCQTGLKRKKATRLLPSIFEDARHLLSSKLGVPEQSDIVAYNVYGWLYPTQPFHAGISSFSFLNKPNFSQTGWVTWGLS